MNHINLLQPQTKTWNTAFYIRLSQDDKDKNISNSVVNQIKMLKKHVENSDKDEFAIVDTYIDDGYTGTNFNRPGFSRMMDDIKTGKVNCIIVKDLSRFGREHIDVDNYLERIFPMLGVRFISIMQHLDSYKYPKKLDSIEIPFLNLINEEYARDISRKTKANLHSKRKLGKYVGSMTPYGYIKDPKDRNHLLVDEEAATHIVNIFNWYINGMSHIDIAKRLNDKGVLSPSAHKVKIGAKKRPKNANDQTFLLWNSRVVRRILHCPLYTGDMVQGTTISYSHKVKKRIPLPKEKWVVVPNTHQAIIDRKTYEIAQSLLIKKARPKATKSEPSPLARYIKCADCGKAMVRTTTTRNGKTYKKYVCSTSKRYGKEVCSTHIIDEDVLLDILRHSIQAQIKCALDLEQLIKKIKHSDTVNRTIAFLQKKHRTLEKEINRISRLKQGLYEDCKSGLITEQEYSDMKANYKQKHKELNIEISNLSKQITDIQNQTIDKNNFISKFKAFSNISIITRDVVVALIDEIIVYEGRCVNIKFKYQDEYKKLSSIFANE